MPQRWKIGGWILAVAGFIIGLLRFQHDVKPPWLDVKVFAFYYSFFETKYFSIIDHNITDEIAGILLLCGLTLLCFSREKIEDEHTRHIRLQSLILSSYMNIVFLLLAFSFIYGIAFIHILIINLFTPLFFYYIVFSIVLQKQKSNARTTSPTEAQLPQ